jgi:hypothetical protein
MDTKIRHAWYSVRQAALCGTVFYRTLDGKEVECSMVSDTEDHRSGWEDIAYIGQVRECIRRGAEGDMPDPDFDYKDGLASRNWMSKMQSLIEREQRAAEVARDPKRWN